MTYDELPVVEKSHQELPFSLESIFSSKVYFLKFPMLYVIGGTWHHSKPLLSVKVNR